MELNKPVTIELLYDEPIVGESRYGEYYLYAVKNGGDEELSFFAPNEQVHEKMKELKKGERIQITKTAAQSGKKIVHDYELKVMESKTRMPEQSTDNYFDLLLRSYEDALRIQNKLNGLVDMNKIAITLFIARSKASGGVYEALRN